MIDATPRPHRLARQLGIGFLAGALATVLFHQPTLALLCGGWGWRRSHPSP